MSDSNKKVNLLALSGSLRSGSTCTAVLGAVKQRLESKGTANVRMFPLHDLPLYNQDHDGDAPPAAVAALRQSVADSDGLVICSPEYNHGMSGVLKNAIDWASRPAFKSNMIGKIALIMTASPAATGGVRAQSSIRDALLSCGCRVAMTPQIVIPAVFNKFVDGVFSDEETLAFTENAVTQMIAQM